MITWTLAVQSANDTHTVTGLADIRSIAVAEIADAARGEIFDATGMVQYTFILDGQVEGVIGTGLDEHRRLDRDTALDYLDRVLDSLLAPCDMPA